MKDPQGGFGCKGYTSLIFSLFHEENYSSTQLRAVLDPQPASIIQAGKYRGKNALEQMGAEEHVT